ncbi:MAG TPA: tRNA glutamyl-Q(34) synthetase GluQRS [Candidatus Limnocylindrales bacterium]|nr:tRNA glutamyl-Q(34) synthetase GluQRS [Candidatus Limnocylindrales bacterium]
MTLRAAGPRGRYAPSPTGLLHIGNARTALAAWLSVRSRGGTFILRIEDIDAPRTVPGMADAAIEDLSWLGLDWDEDPVGGGPFGPYTQSQRSDRYEAALQMLHDSGRLFPCRLSRKELAGIASAPHAGEEGPPYPVSARPAELPGGWYEALRAAAAPDAAIRFRVAQDVVRFFDRVHGAVEEDVATSVGDFVLKRRDGLYAYQLAVVVDDWLMEVDEVVRGADLLGSTARQIQLLEALGARRPEYAHVPLVVAQDGARLSKRDAALTLRALRHGGVRAEQLVGLLAWSLGLLETPAACSASDLIGEFAWTRLRAGEWRIPADVAARAAALR